MISPQQADIIITELQSQGDVLFKQTMKEESRINELNNAIAAAEREVITLKGKKNEFQINAKKIGGIDATIQNDRNITKQIRILENRLNKLNIRLNETCNHNKRMKESIDKLRRNRMTFNKLHDRMKRRYEKVQSDITSVLEYSTRLNEQRETATIQFEALVEEDNALQRIYEEQMQTNLEIIERQRALENKLKSKKSSDEEDESLFRGDLPPAQEAELKVQAKQLILEAKEGRNKLKNIRQEIRAYEEAFEKLKKKAKTSNLEEVVKLFVDREEVNFSIFNHIQVLNGEIDKVEHEIIHVQSKKNRFREAEAKKNEDQSKIFTTLQNNLNIVKSANYDYDKTQETSTDTLKQLSQSVQNIFFQANCQTLMDELEAKGRKVGVVRKNGIVEVTEHSIVQYLAIVEQRALELIEKYRIMMEREDDNILDGSMSSHKLTRSLSMKQMMPTKFADNIPDFGPAIPMQSDIIKITPPKSYDDGDDEEDDFFQPWSTSEIKKKLAATVGKTKSKKSMVYYKK